MKTAIVAVVCLYGNRTLGAGYLAQVQGERPIGDADPAPQRSFTEAVYLAVAALEKAYPKAMGRKGGMVRVFAAGGELQADVPVGNVPNYGNMPWERAVPLVIPADKLAALES